MRKIQLTEPDTPEWTAWKTKCEDAREKVIAAAEAGEKIEIIDLYKAQKDWFRDTSGIFFGKCAYCEQVIIGNQRGDVEHYRPKAGVQDEDCSPIEVETTDGPKRHPGYYWLAYDIRNLLLACIGCNQLVKEPRYGKGNRFPVVGSHAWAPGEEATEEPKLLNPYFDDPRDHIQFDIDTGVLIPVTERGRATIDIFGLNMRDLPRRRFQAYEAMNDRFNSILMRRQDKEPGWARNQFAALANDNLSDFASVAKLALSRAASEVLGALGEI